MLDTKARNRISTAMLCYEQLKLIFFPRHNGIQQPQPELDLPRAFSEFVPSRVSHLASSVCPPSTLQ